MGIALSYNEDKTGHVKSKILRRYRSVHEYLERNPKLRNVLYYGKRDKYVKDEVENFNKNKREDVKLRKDPVLGPFLPKLESILNNEISIL